MKLKLMMSLAFVLGIQIILIEIKAALLPEGLVMSSGAARMVRTFSPTLSLRRLQLLNSTSSVKMKASSTMYYLI